jgi:hypothetical protein
MKEEVTRQGSRDFRQRYEGTYGFYTTEEGSKLLVVIDSVNEEEVKFRDSKRLSYTALSDRGLSFEFLSPVKRLFAIGDMVYLIERRPARQFQRGVSANNTRIYKLDTMAPVPINFNNLAAAFDEDTEVRYKLQLVRMEKGLRKTLLLSDMLAFVNGSVYLYKDVIGRLDLANKKVVLSKNMGMFRQEVLDAIRDTGINIVVEVENV